MYQFDLDIKPASQQFQKGSEEKQKIIQHNFNLIQQQLNQQQLFDQIQQEDIQQNQEYQDNYDEENQYQIDSSQNIQQSDQHYQNMEQQQGQFQHQQIQQQNEQQQQFEQQNQSQQYQNGNVDYLQDQENFQNQSNEQYNFEENGNFMDKNENHQQKSQKNSNNQSQQSSHSEDEEELDESDENDNGQILDMSIDLGDDNVQHLIVYEGDDPMQLAKEFVEANELNEDALEYLGQNIMENMQEAIKEKNEKRQIRQQKKLQKIKEKEEKQQQKEQKRLIKQQEKQKQDTEQEKSNIQQEAEQQSQQKQIRKQNNQQFSQNNVEFSQDNNQSGTQLYETFQASQQQPFFGTYNQFFSASKGKIPVHDRLYLEAQQKEIRLQQKKQLQIQQHNEQHKSIHSLKSPTMKKFGDQSINHGEYLYYSAIQKKEEKEQYTKKIKQFQEQIEASDATFHPKICQKSIILAEQKKQFALPEDRFRENQYFVNKRKEELKIAVKNKELEECSFHPQINNVSAQIQEIKRKQSQEQFNRFQVLFNEAKDRQWRLQEKKLELLQQEESQMNPQIIRRPPLNDDKTSFFERLDKYNKEKVQRSLNLNIQPMVNEKDLKECVFKPKVGRGPQYERNVDKKPIGEYLNSQKDKKQIIQETLLQKDQELQQSMMHKPLSVSSNILNEKKDRILSELFNILDSDGDGFITSNNQDISQLNNDILRIFSSFFKNMQQQQIQYDLEQFQNAAKQYLDKLSFQDREFVYNDSKFKWIQRMQKEEQNQKKNLEINPKSKKIVEKNRKKNNIAKSNLYLSGIQQKQLKEARIQQQKQENELNQLRDCSFKPNLIQPLPIYSFSQKASSNKQSQLTNKQSNKSNNNTQNIQDQQQQILQKNQNNISNNILNQLYNEQNYESQNQSSQNLQPQFQNFLQKLQNNLSPQNKLTITQQLQLSNKLQANHNKNLEISSKFQNLINNQKSPQNNIYEQQLTEQLYSDEQEQLNQFSQYEKMLENQQQQQQQVL